MTDIPIAPTSLSPAMKKVYARAVKTLSALNLTEWQLESAMNVIVDAAMVAVDETVRVITEATKQKTNLVSWQQAFDALCASNVYDTEEALNLTDWAEAVLKVIGYPRGSE